MSTSGVWSVCEDASRGGEEGEEEQADAGQRRVQEDDGGGKVYTQVKGQASFLLAVVISVLKADIEMFDV